MSPREDDLRLAGGCHCRAIRYTLTWPASRPIPARRCGCGYCRRFGGTWTSHPDARLKIRMSHEQAARAYRFGTGTADFLSCARCGVVFAAIDGQGEAAVAIVNVPTLDQSETLDLQYTDSDFDGEPVDERRARRRRNWCGSVRIEFTEDKPPPTR